MTSDHERSIASESLLTILPHRFPFLLVDRIVEIERGVRIVGLKNVTTDEPFFNADNHMGMTLPALLIVEALAQTAAVLLMVECEPSEGNIAYFAGLDRVVWPGTVRAGDQLRLEIAVTHSRGRLRKVRGVASVDGVTVCEADLAAVVVNTRSSPA